MLKLPQRGGNGVSQRNGAEREKRKHLPENTVKITSTPNWLRMNALSEMSSRLIKIEELLHRKLLSL